MKKDDAKNIIIKAIKNNVDLSDEQENILLENPDNFTILGMYDNIDSLDLVSILVEVESQVIDMYSITIMLSSDKAMSQQNSPFRDVKSLVIFLIEEFENEKRIN